MKLQFKFKATADAKRQEEVIAVLRRHGATQVRALFPDDRDAELARLYIVDVGDEPSQQRALSWLRKSRAVEFAEPEIVRKLIR